MRIASLERLGDEMTAAADARAGEISRNVRESACVLGGSLVVGPAVGVGGPIVVGHLLNFFAGEDER